MTEGFVTVKAYSKTQARIRGVGVFTFMYTLGTISALSPFFHVLPPIWIVLAPIVGTRIYRYYVDIIRIHGTRPLCPCCHEEVWLPLRRSRQPTEVNCRACGEHLRLEWALP
jgi:hypothetical protein